MLLQGIILSLFAGLAITAGAWLASLKMFHSVWMREEFRHSIIAFGAGALISAVAFVLIPDGAKYQSNMSTVLTFLAGGIVFMIIDRLLASSNNKLAQFIAMMLDFIPEAIVLGAIVTQDFTKAIFLTLVIAAQNLPEGYAAYISMRKKERNHLGLFLLVGLTGPIYILLGANVFISHPTILGMMMTFCAGGIVYLVFEDIAPNVVMEKHWLPPLGAVFGFAVGMLGYLYT